MEAMTSPVWNMVSELRPALAPRVRLLRQSFRGRLWYLLQDSASARFHRFSPQAHYLLSIMDGRSSLQQLWDMSLERWGDQAPGQAELVRLLAQLHAHDLLRCDMSTDVQALLDRTEHKIGMGLRQKLMSPLSIRLPLFDPDRFLERTQHLVKPVFSRAGFVLWLAIVSMGIVLAGIHWEALNGNFSDRVFSPGNLLTMVLIYPVVKLFHELGHAYAVKRWSGEVHDLGILFLVFMPVPYVDATASSAFRDKHKRMLVGAAGIMVELVVASLAMLIWTEAQPGLLRSIAFNVMLIGGVSTLFFNGNPLLRFDGYYVFSDALEIPNLGPRSTSYLGYLVQRYLLRSKLAERPIASVGEARWFVIYGLSSFVYRLFIMVTIVLFVAGEFFFIGVLLALWACNAMVVLPLWRKLKFLFGSPVFRENRGQAVMRSMATVAVLSLLVAVIPLPSYTTAEGVVWAPENAEIRAPSSGFLRRMNVVSNDQVGAGQPLFTLEDPLLKSEIRVLQNRVAELSASFQSELQSSPAQAQVTRARLQTVSSQLARASERGDALQINSPDPGILLMRDEGRMIDRYYEQGELLAYVAEFPLKKAIAVVQQDYIGQVRQGIESVELRFASRVERVWPVRVVREIPASTQTLPSSALGENGGGRIKLDPMAGEVDRAFEEIFQFEIELPEAAVAGYIGERVFLRFYHGRETLAAQVWRGIRRAFLKRFSV